MPIIKANGKPMSAKELKARFDEDMAVFRRTMDAMDARTAMGISPTAVKNPNTGRYQECNSAQEAWLASLTNVQRYGTDRQFGNNFIGWGG